MMSDISVFMKKALNFFINSNFHALFYLPKMLNSNDTSQTLYIRGTEFHILYNSDDKQCIYNFVHCWEFLLH